MDEELSNPELEEQLLRAPNDAKTWQAYEAWLIECGEPRGALMRAGRPGAPPEAAQRIVAAQWKNWFGELRPDAVVCEWNHGFVQSLRITSSIPAELMGRALFTKRSLRFLRTLTIDAGVEGSLYGIEVLQRLHRIELTASVRLLNELAQLRPVALAELQVCGPFSTEIFNALARIPWRADLRRLELGAVRVPDVQARLAQKNERAPPVPGLKLRVDEDTVRAYRDSVRAAFPGVRIETAVDARKYGYEWLNPIASPQPKRAPANFRELPPELTRSEPAVMGSYAGQMDEYQVGSGVRVTESSREYSRCAACGSEDTLRIYSKFKHRYSEQRFENYYWSIREFVCNECGEFTSYEAYRES